MGLLVLDPLLFPLALPLLVSPPVQGFDDAIDKVPERLDRADVVRLRPGREARAGADDAHRAPPPVRQATARS